ncbi:hypothetical protein ACFYXL_02080 [Streptomyces tsukubensis]|uniref:hypothetical protein n=1 Tax=Streptomyces tsukubensis TaxID=83656 RepID=UPI0036846EC3
MADPTLTDARTSAVGPLPVPSPRGGPGAAAALRSARGSGDGARQPSRGEADASAGHHWDARRAVAPVLGVSALNTLVHLLVLTAMLPPGWSLRDRLLSWDAALYRDIATEGYPPGLSYGDDGEPTGNNLAFFPLYPLLIRAVHGLTGLDAGGVAVAVAQLSLLGALFAVHALLTRLYGSRTALAGVVLLAGAQPMAVTFLMGYSESLFLALAAGALLAAHREAWAAAGVLGLLAGLTRPAAFAVAVALAVAAVLAMRRGGFSWRPVGAVALACTGTPAYLLWVGWRSGQLNAWFVIQEAGWGTRWDNGAAFFSFLAHTWEHADGWVPVSTAVLLLAAVGATAVAWRRGTWPPLLVYGTVMVVLTLAQSNYYHSKLRLLVPALVFLLPFAVALGRARTRTAVAVLAAATLFGSWYGAHMLTVWRYAI